MSVGIIGVLVIAALFFVVSMAVAVGPLMLCRIFADPGKDDPRPQPRRSSLASGVLTFCGVVVGLGVGLFMLYFTLRSSMDRPHATVVYDDGAEVHLGPLPTMVMEGGTAFSAEFSPVPVEFPPEMPIQFSEHSLFAPPPPLVPPYPAHRDADAARPLFSRSAVEIGSIVLMVLVLVVTAIAVLGSETIRAGLARLTPVVLAIALLGVLFFWSFDGRVDEGYADRPAEITMHGGGVSMDAARAVEAPMPPSPVVQEGNMVQIPSTIGAADEQLQSDAGATAPKPSESAESSAEKADPPVLAYVGVAPAGVPQKTLPKWTAQSDDEGPIRVVDSGLHATVQLAEEHALKELKTLLQSQMVQRTPQAAGWEAPDEAVLNAGNILQRAVERTQIQVGENTIPMYEAYWQVDLSRLEPLYRAWRPNVVQQRLTRIAGGVALLMLLLGSIAGILRVDEQTHGHRRKSLTAGSLTLLALIGGLALVVVA
jgi:hypothetical protein